MSNQHTTNDWGWLVKALDPNGEDGLYICNHGYLFAAGLGEYGEHMLSKSQVEALATHIQQEIAKARIDENQAWLDLFTNEDLAVVEGVRILALIKRFRDRKDALEAAKMEEKS